MYYDDLDAKMEHDKDAVVDEYERGDGDDEVANKMDGVQEAASKHTLLEVT